MKAFWDVAPCSLVEVDPRFRRAQCLNSQGTLTEAVRTTERSVNFNETTQRYIPESCHFLTRRCENLKFHNVYFC
jgi:hypothetical protein